MSSSFLLRLLLIALVGGSGVAARVGERQAQFEQRLLQPNVGRFFSWKGIDEKQRAQMNRENPLDRYKQFFPDDVKEMVYWKSAMRGTLSNDTGWRVYVYYYKDVSVAEAYRRVGSSLTDAEVKGLLALNRGSDTWARTERKPGGDESVLGSEFELKEAGVRSRRAGDWMIFYLAKFDEMMVEGQKEKAPESVEGF